MKCTCKLCKGLKCTCKLCKGLKCTCKLCKGLKFTCKPCRGLKRFASLFALRVMVTKHVVKGYSCLFYKTNSFHLFVKALSIFMREIGN